MKNIKVMMLYLAPMSFKSTTILESIISYVSRAMEATNPAMAADPRFVLSMRLAQ